MKTKAEIINYLQNRKRFLSERIAGEKDYIETFRMGSQLSELITLEMYIDGEYDREDWMMRANPTGKEK